MYLSIDELRAFTVLASELHFRRAAERLFLSQPALTRLVQRLETTVGGELLQRTRRKVSLTETGRALLPRAEQLLRDSEETLERVREVAQGRAGTLRIGFGIASVCDILPRAIQRFRKSYPRVDLHMRDMATGAQLEALRRGEIDLGIVRFSNLPEETDGFPLFSDRLVLVTPRGFAYNARRGLRGLARASFIALPATVSTTFHEHVLNTCRRAGFTPRVVQEAGEIFTVLNLVRGGLGVALVPHAALRMNVPGVSFHDVRDPQAVWRIGPVWSRGTDKLDLIGNFCGALRAVVPQDQ